MLSASEDKLDTSIMVTNMSLFEDSLVVSHSRTHKMAQILHVVQYSVIKITVQAINSSDTSYLILCCAPDV